jgi:hypothetical protein
MMINTSLTALLIGMMLTCPSVGTATPTMTMDSSIGGNPSQHYPYGDSIGVANFDLPKMFVEFDGISPKLDIYADRTPGNWPGSSKFSQSSEKNSDHAGIKGADRDSFPEPAAMLFFGTGLVGLGGLAGSKRKKLPARSSTSAGSANGENTGKGNYRLQHQNSQALAGLPL